ncbi:hypothetical protein [Vallitalea okinawensis]|uniref:hypothetical protein n=1 Tax=Vallitalea okinawensis TaxID=2078660 RepID=UPI0013004468|nr:hypothetical protein [Vallitalea okinawensis]
MKYLQRIAEKNKNRMKNNEGKDNAIFVFYGSQSTEPKEDRSELWLTLSMSSQRWRVY